MMRACLCLLVFLAATASAIDTDRAFEDDKLQARYEAIIEEVRCLKCQNQSIKDSNAFLAADLRREIRRMISEGMSDDEIYAFLVERYGEFALYRPRASGKTLILWLAPAALLLLGLFLLGRILRRRMALPVDEDDADDVSPTRTNE
jgi:cytochrome c-type biogenesis protein CcmH